jgi:hypothetical protein
MPAQKRSDLRGSLCEDRRLTTSVVIWVLMATRTARDRRAKEKIRPCLALFQSEGRQTEALAAGGIGGVERIDAVLKARITRSCACRGRPIAVVVRGGNPADAPRRCRPSEQPTIASVMRA